MALTSFNLYFSYLPGFEVLTDAETGRLIKGALLYAEKHTAPEFAGNERYLWPLIKSQIDRDQAAYYAKCERNAENAKQRTQANASDGNRTQATASDGNQYKDKDKDKDKDKYIKEKDIEREKKPAHGARAFVPPTVDEIRAYCDERKNKIDPAAFVDYYSSQKWRKANGQPLSDWKAAVRTWERRDDPGRDPGTGTSDLLTRALKKRNGGAA